MCSDRDCAACTRGEGPHNHYADGIFCDDCEHLNCANRWNHDPDSDPEDED